MPENFSSLWDGILAALPNVLTSILIFALSYYAGVWLSRMLKRILQRNNAEPGISHLLSQILKWTFITLGLIVALQRFFDVTAFLTGLGILGFTIGFALQNIMQNFVSGIILLVQQPFKVGDDVKVAGFEGTVLKIGLRTTELKLRNGLMAFLPNADVLAQPIINLSRAHHYRVELPVSVPYSAKLEDVRVLVLGQIKSVPGSVETLAPQVLFHTFGQFAVDLTLYFWVDTLVVDPPVAKDMALTKIKQAFADSGIDVPYPTQIVRSQPAESSKRKASSKNK